MINSVIHWDVDPIAFKIGLFTIKWYAIGWGCTFFVGYHALNELLKHDKIPNNFTSWCTLYMLFGAIIGARLGHCFFYDPLYYLHNPSKIFALSGLSSHGGGLGMLVVLYILSRQLKIPYIYILDRLAIMICVGGFFIRMGNLMNSEIYGHVTTLPWGFIFERRGETLPKHPTQIYEALYYALTYVVLRTVYRKCDNRPRPFLMLGLFWTIVFVFRFCIEFIKNPQRPFEENMLFNMGQLLSIPCIIAGIIALIVSRKKEYVSISNN